MIQLLLETFSISAIQKCLVSRQSTFLPLLNIFLRKIFIHCHLVPNTLEIQDLPKANIPKGYTMSSNTNPLKNIITLICKALILNKKQWFVEPQLTLHWLSESYTSKIDLAIKECKRFPLVMIKTGSFNKCCERF